MCVGTQQRVRDVSDTVVEFASAFSSVGHVELRVAAERLALEGACLFENHGHRCCSFLLTALQSASSAQCSDAMTDSVWMLQRMAQNSEVARSWILESRGVEIVYDVLVTHHEQKQLAQQGAWLVYVLDGLRGLSSLVFRSKNGSSSGHVALRCAVAWAVFELVRSHRAASKEQLQLLPDSANMLALLVEAMAHESTNSDVQWACVAALDAMVKFDPRLGTLFLSQNGSRLLVRALRAAGAMGADGVDFRRALGYLIASLAEGNAHAVNSLRAEGAIVVLTEVGLHGDGQDVEATMWALASLGGLRVVLDAMAGAHPAKPAVLRGGIIALNECAWHAPGDQEELSRLPAALAVLLEFMDHQEGLGSRADMLGEGTRALGSVLASLVPHAPPGRLHDVDRGVHVLLKRLRALPCLEEMRDSTSPNPNLGEVAQQWTDNASSLGGDAAEAAAEAIGRIAVIAPEWRRGLRQYGALEAFARWIHCNTSVRLKKYIFWAAGAIAGLPFVANEMRRHAETVEIVSAAMCTMTDILDDDLEGEYALVGADRCDDSDVPALLGLVVEMLRLHAGAADIQARGCCCVELLMPHVPLASVAAVAPTSVVVALAALRRFPRRSDVARGACAALRSVCLRTKASRGHAPVGGGAASSCDAVAAEITSTLVVGDAADCVGQILSAFESGSGGSALLEDASAVIIMTAGVETLLSHLVEAPATSPCREAGLKALFEICSTDLQLLATRDIVNRVVEVCAEMEKDLQTSNTSNAECRLRQHASLLLGLCGQATA
eukprot:TRINITY_DN16312_c3_g1_i1.p1 TRINITY_DN16312_c3_g1~~TRINITY_DN16312_c3_g1_i1.p1  ORF type:complete len:780 (-),score=136.92 TRINITY_DN16312_c3_g1_i1:463-2802(-)